MKLLEGFGFFFGIPMKNEGKLPWNLSENTQKFKPPGYAAGHYAPKRLGDAPTAVEEMPAGIICVELGHLGKERRGLSLFFF